MGIGGHAPPGAHQRGGLQHAREVPSHRQVPGGLSAAVPGNPGRPLPGDEGAGGGAEEREGAETVEVRLVQVPGDQADV